jgi:glycyl-tRNA synthetase beta chain
MSETRTLLLELHCEEIPARFLKPLSMEFAGSFATWAVGEKLSITTSQVHYSPRKLSWRVEGLPAAQPDQTETQVGPPQRLCVDEAGAPTIQGQKFAEKWGVAFSEIEFTTPTGKKEPCATVTLTKQGRPTQELLAEALPRLIGGLHVPKAMRWGHSDFEFVRPIRNILCLFGSDVVPFTVDGVKTGNTTWGHRQFHMQHAEPLKVASPEGYEAALKDAGVLVSFDERRDAIEAEMQYLASQVSGRVVEDEELLATLAEIVERPRVVRGEFPPEFMSLPKEVLVTSLKEHQKSFCIEDEQGVLRPYFLTVANRADDPEGFVKSGNEWVLKARLYDARFFFAEDLKSPLIARLEGLEHLTFHRELGSYLEKTNRIATIAKELATRLNLDAGQAETAAKACKCDLRTLMVGEFPELQGVMGGEYLKHEGAPEGVWKAVKEHYEPSAADAPIPSSELGCVLAIADKLDTLVGCFAIGQIPSGSKDPLALRRAGAGITRILWERGWSLSPMELCKLALKALGSRASKPEGDTLEALGSFFRDRVAYQLEVAGYAGAVRRAALPVGWTDLLDLKARCEALSAFAEDARFASLGQSAKRIGNILKDEVPSDALDADKLQEAEEKALASQLSRLETAVDHRALLSELATLAEPLEAFFSAVMVKCEDPLLRAARLSLLHRLRKAFLRVADFSQWQ